MVKVSQKCPGIVYINKWSGQGSIVLRFKKKNAFYNNCFNLTFLFLNRDTFVHRFLMLQKYHVETATFIQSLKYNTESG